MLKSRPDKLATALDDWMRFQDEMYKIEWGDRAGVPEALMTEPYQIVLNAISCLTCGLRKIL